MEEKDIRSRLASRRAALVVELRELDTTLAVIDRLERVETKSANGHGEKSKGPLSAHEFRGLTVGVAIVKLMRLVPPPLTTRQIADHLKEHGIKHRSKRFDATVYTALKRLVEDGKLGRSGTSWDAVSGPVFTAGGAVEGKEAVS